MFILDTNAMSDYFTGHPKVVSRFHLALNAGEHTVTTTITRYEILMKGRYQALLTATDHNQLMAAQARLDEDEIRLSEFEQLTITESTAYHFVRLKGFPKVRKIGPKDLLIACISLAHAATLITRNTKDFAGIPNLKLENWAA